MKPACGPPYNIGTPKRWAEPTTTSAPSSTRRLEQGQRQQVGDDRDQAAALVRGVDQRPQVADLAGGARVLHQHAAEVTLGQPVGGVGDHDLDAERPRPGLHDGERLRQAVGVDQEPVATASL